jgi:hypothetical protein
VQADDVVQIRDGRRVGRAGARGARIVHEPRNGELRGHLLRHGAGRLGIGQVGLEEGHVGMGPGGGNVIDVDHPGDAIGQQHFADGAANAGTGTGNERGNGKGHLNTPHRLTTPVPSEKDAARPASLSARPHLLYLVGEETALNLPTQG